MTKANKNTYIAAFLIALLMVVFLVGGGISNVYAAASGYSDVMTDLKQDLEFDIWEYPADSEDYSIKVIQIAESKNGELFVYVYQPCGQTRALIATNINMSLSESVDGTRLYSLTLINASGVFYKYKVNDFAVSSESVRYYNISSIYRKWYADIDGEPSNDNTKNEKAFGVGKVFKAETVDGNVTYSCAKVDVVTILNPFVGHLVYQDSYGWDNFIFDSYDLTDVHYIAFDTDFPIDKLEEVDVSYITQSYTWHDLTGEYSYSEKSDTQYLTLTTEDEGGAVGFNGWFFEYYNWKRIQSSADFIKTVTLTDEAYTSIQRTKWILLFLETEKTVHETTTLSGHDIIENGTRVSDVTILRLKFVTAGKVYNLGTVSDKVTGSDNPSGGPKEKSWFDLLCEWLAQKTGIPAWVWKIIFYALPFVILLPVLSVFFPVVGQVLAAVLKAIGKAFVWLLKGVWWLICLPFKGIAALIRKIRHKDGKAHA